MNSEKAREFFSSYFEGSLDSGLKLALEQKFKSDAELKEDYEAFALAFADLNSLRDEDIEIPIYLSDRIATRIEEARQQQRKPFALWNLPWLKAAPMYLAAIAILGTGLGLAVKSRTALGGVLPGGHEKQVDLPTFKVEGSDVTLMYQPHASHTVVIKSGSTGTVLSSIKLEEGQAVEPKLNNDNATAQLFKIQEDSEPEQYIVVPGKQSDSSQPTGDGTIGDFALAVANYYHVPLLMENVSLDTKIKWTLDGIDATKSANTNLQPIHLSADLRTDGMLSINGH